MKPDEPTRLHGANPTLDSFRDHVAELLKRAKTGADLKAATFTAYRQLDGTVAKAVSESGHTVACKEGCFYCCHLKVDASPVEVFLIADYIRKHFTEEERTDIEEAARANVAKIKPLSNAQHELANIPCALLRSGKCSVYRVRPGMCRIMHSRDVEVCRTGFENPQQVGLVGYIPSVRGVTAAAHIGTHEAYAEAEYDTLAYDLNAALLEALRDSVPEKRWRSKKAAFPQTALAKDVVERRNSKRP